MNYTGIVIEESLDRPLVINNLCVVGARISDDDDPSERWHLYKVSVSAEEITALSKNIKRGWYAHFWKGGGEDMTVVFRDKIFKVDTNDESTWKETIDYGLSVGIIPEQLGFRPE